MYMYELGDKVLIKSDLNWICGTVSEMHQYGDRIATITKVDVRGYDIDLDKGKFYWTEGMIKCKVEETKEEESMCKYKSGDKVRIRKDLECETNYNNINFSSEMEKLKGKIVTIETVREDRAEYGCRENGYRYAEEMFEDVFPTFVDVILSIKDGDTYKSREKERTISQVDGILILDGCEEVTLNETFYKIQILKILDVLKEENDDKSYRVICNGKDKGIYKVKDYADGDLELEDEYGDDIYDELCLSQIMLADYIEVM